MHILSPITELRTTTGGAVEEFPYLWCKRDRRSDEARATLCPRASLNDAAGVNLTACRYEVPECIKDQCSQAKYSKWLRAKASAHVRRDRKRFERSCIVAEYKRAIHEAVTKGGDLDHYSGEKLDWTLVSTFNNAAAVEGRVKYKKTFALLPTLDHTEDENGQPKFVICSWRVNDMKSDMSKAEFIEVCERVLRHRESR
jgi:hypothetical protein